MLGSCFYKNDLKVIFVYTLRLHLHKKYPNNSQKYLKIQDGPILGKVINYLSMELAYNRLNNFDEAIYKGKQWIQQNAPKCD